MRWVAIALSSLLVGACSGDAGALLVLDYVGDPAELGATEVEIVLADPEPAARGEFLQRRNTTENVEEEVLYYREVTTTQRAMLDGASVDGFAIRLEVDPQIAMTKAIPFVLVYRAGIDGERELVAAGRLGDADPGELVVPNDVVHRFTVALERILPPDATGIEPGRGGLHRCDDRTLTGAVLRFATTRQIRLAFLASSPYDLDCDQARVDEAVDCNDLSPKFFVANATPPETCSQAEDYNCSGGIESQVTCNDVRSIHTGQILSQCLGRRDCSDMTACSAIDPISDGCRCGLAECRPGGCKLFVSNITPGFMTPCAPAVAELSLCDEIGGCRFKLFDVGQIDATVELGVLQRIVFDTTPVDVPRGDPVYVRVSPSAPAVLGAALGPFTLEQIGGVSPRAFLTYTVSVDPSLVGECPRDNAVDANVMVCDPS